MTAEALRLYETVHKQGVLGRIWSMLTGQPRRLLDLETIRRTANISSRHYAGIQTVPIAQIRGSEGRSAEFDTRFRPLQSHTKDRWVKMAVAQTEGRMLPLVELIQVGDTYFVRDGHHRISVAQALGQEEIEAVVTVWETTGALPPKPPVVCNATEKYPSWCENVWV
jgi:hypothetical protein